jgi:hypothetical protein
MLGAIGNIQTRVMFGLARRDADWFAHEVGQIDTQAVKREPQTETQHPVFSPMAEQWEEWAVTLKQQPSRQALVAGQDGKVARIWTMRISPYTVSEEEAEAFRRHCLRKHGVPVSRAQRNLQQAVPNRELEMPPAYEGAENVL